MNAEAANALLRESIEKDSLPGVLKALEAGADPDAPLNPGYTLAHHAITHGRPEALRLLIERGATIDAPNEHDLGAAWLALAAVAAGQPQVLEIVLQAGARVDQPGSNGETLLHGAVGLRHASAVRQLLQRGVDPNARNKAGNTPLHSFYLSGNAGTALALLAVGADLDAENGRGCRPLHMSVSHNHSRSILVLKALGASTWGVMSGNDEMEDILCSSRLACAVQTGSLSLVHHVLSHDAGVTAKEFAQALDVAEDDGNEEVASLLRIWAAQRAAGQAVQDLVVSDPESITKP